MKVAIAVLIVIVAALLVRGMFFVFERAEREAGLR